MYHKLSLPIPNLGPKGSTIILNKNYIKCYLILKTMANDYKRELEYWTFV